MAIFNAKENNIDIDILHAQIYSFYDCVLCLGVRGNRPHVSLQCMLFLLSFLIIFVEPMVLCPFLFVNSAHDGFVDTIGEQDKGYYNGNDQDCQGRAFEMLHILYECL